MEIGHSAAKSRLSRARLQALVDERPRPETPAVMKGNLSRVSSFIDRELRSMIYVPQQPASSRTARQTTPRLTDRATPRQMDRVTPRVQSQRSLRNVTSALICAHGAPSFQHNVIMSECAWSNVVQGRAEDKSGGIAGRQVVTPSFCR